MINFLKLINKIKFSQKYNFSSENTTINVVGEELDTPPSDIALDVLNEELNIQSPDVYSNILFKVPKELLDSMPSNSVIPRCCCPVISDFQVFESLEKYYTNVNNPCNPESLKIQTYYFLDNMYISATVYYNVMIKNNDDMYDFTKDFYTVLPFEYCGYEYIPNPVAKDFAVNLNIMESPIFPISETEEYYIYEATVKSNIYLITSVIIDINDKYTLLQLNSALEKPSENNVFTLKELSTINELSYDDVDVNSIDKNVFRYLPNLKNLSITNCSLDNIFIELFDLVKLENLNLSNNNLNSLPQNFNRLGNLKTLYLNDNKLYDLSLFKDSNIIVYATNQEIEFDILDKSISSNIYEQPLSFLLDYNGAFLNVTSSSGHVTNNLITWNPSESGKTVYFQFNNNKRFSGTVSLYLKDYNYEITSEGVITKYNKLDPSVTDLHIPEYINNIKVKSIGNNAFYECDTLISIELPQGVTSISQNAFYHCEDLEYINLPSGINTIQDHAFNRCNKLKSIDIPDSVTTLGEYAFAGCFSLESIKIPSEITQIANGLLSDCTGLESIILPDNVVSLGEYAFTRCTSLKNIYIPDKVTSIGVYAFARCSSLKSINIPSNLSQISNYVFSDCTALEYIYIPHGVISIGLGAFQYCENLESVDIADSVTSIGLGAFYRCDNLSSINIPLTVNSLGDYAFSFCNNLNSITIPYRFCKVDNKDLFEGVHDVTSLTITATWQEINQNTSLDDLKIIWDNCANNLFGDTHNIMYRYIIINGIVKDVR